MNGNVKAGGKSTEKIAYPGDCFWNMPFRQGGTRGVRHHYYALKACGDNCYE